MGFFRLLSKQKAAGRDTMFQGNGVDGKRAILHNQRMTTCIHRIETDFVRHAFAECIQYRTHIVFNSFGCMYHQFAGASQHTECGDQAGQTKTMVTMQVGYENMIQPAEFDTHMAHLHLCAFATVYHI